MRNRYKVIIGAAITILLVGLLLTQIDPGSIVQTLSELSPRWLALGFVLYGTGYVFRAARFRVLLRDRITFRGLFPIVCVHNMVNNISPARIGELSYVYMVRKLHDMPTADGLATLAVARILDLIVISVIFIIATLSIKDEPGLLVSGTPVIVGFLIAAVLLLVALAYHGRGFVKAVETGVTRLRLGNSRGAKFLLRKGEEIAENFDTMKSARTVLYCLFFSAFIWITNYVLTYLLLDAMGVSLSFWTVVLGSTFVVLATILPIHGLAGFGTHEAIWTVTFMALGVSKEVAITSGFAIHVVMLTYYVALGACGLFFVQRQGLFGR